VRRMCQGAGGGNRGSRDGQGKQRRPVAPLNSISAQTRRGQLTVLVRMTAKS